MVMFRRAVKDLRWNALWYSLGIAAYGLSLAGLYPSIARSTAYQQVLKLWPKALLHAFGISDFGSFSGFIGGEFLNIIWPLMASAFLITAGASVVAQEIERGTIELWLSVPTPRRHLLAAKLLALLIGICVFALATAGAIALGARIIGVALPAGGIGALVLELLTFSVTVAGYSALFSALCSTRGRAAGIAAGATAAFYLAWVISGLSGAWDWLQYFSIFTAYRPQQALGHGTVDIGGGAVLLALGLIAAVGSLAVFERRDLLG